MSKNGDRMMNNDELEKIKIIRDPVHGYISLSEFQIQLIDTLEFQRLKDIRQLTCQHVYPSARHTRFEHSLGVMELTEQAIKRIIRNGFIDGESIENKLYPKLSQLEAKQKLDQLKHYTSLAALLHDIGHSPFSHMGEIEMDEMEIEKAFEDELDKSNIPHDRGLSKEGARHEQMSCIIFLRNYKEKLKIPNNDLTEFVLRCILGFKYGNDTPHENITPQEHKFRDLLIGLVNSTSFDMDKLDYIMRDSQITAIGAPQVDTERLFRNMYILDDSANSEYRIGFTSRAIPALQNLIDARDSAYMFVYNHHAAVYSDFMYSYIFRRLGRNAKEYGTQKNDKESAGKIPKEKFFSVKAISEEFVSDADVQAALNRQARFSDNCDDTEQAKACNRALKLVRNFAKREFLKTWWKTIVEYDNFVKEKLNSHDGKNLIKYICDEAKFSREFCAVFRSEIAKGVIKRSVDLVKPESKFSEAGIKPLEDGDFYVVQRATKFFSKDMIQELFIFLKENEMMSPAAKDMANIGKYHVHSLTELLPQKDYAETFDRNMFFVYMKNAETVNP